MTIKPISFKNNKNQVLRGVVHIPRKYDTAIVILHGFPGRSSGRAELLAKMFRHRGYLAMRFDFSGTDISDGKFENKLMSQEVKDIKYAIDALEKKYGFKKLILYGHSTGAVDALLYAHQDPRITKLIVSGSLVNLKQCLKYDFTQEQITDFKKKGFITYHAPGTWLDKKKLRKAFYDEYFTLNVKEALKKFKKPILIIHGGKDELVPIVNGYETYNCANKPKELVIIKNTNHRFKGIFNKIRLVYYMHRFIQHEQKD